MFDSPLFAIRAEVCASSASSLIVRLGSSDSALSRAAERAELSPFPRLELPRSA
jgi:hypothetical protein